MRLVTWNCCRGPYAKKGVLLDSLSPDVCVIQECGKPEVVSRQLLWFGENPRQGIAVAASGAYELRALPAIPEVPRYVIPVEVTGPSNFVLFAVWTLGKQSYPYVEAAVRAVDLYSGVIGNSPAVLMGDFNSNSIWDATHPKDHNHSALVARLRSLGLVSAYHHIRGETHGRESEATFYLHWKQARPYHIDYCFLPHEWARMISRVEIGSFEAWRAHSDHRPLLVDVAESVI